jgi:hypothetical protein
VSGPQDELLDSVQADLTALSAEVDLPLQDATIVREYLSHGEPGIGLEHLCDILIETDAPITKPQFNRMLAAAAALKLLGSDEWSERLAALAALAK